MWDQLPDKGRPVALEMSERRAHSVRWRWIMRKVVIVLGIIVFSLFTCSIALAQRAGFITAGIAPMSNPVAPMTNPRRPLVHVPFGYGFPTQAPLIVRRSRPSIVLISPFPDRFTHRKLHVFGASHLHVVPHTFPTVIVPGVVFTHRPLFVTPGRGFRNPGVFIGGRRIFRR